MKFNAWFHVSRREMDDEDEYLYGDTDMAENMIIDDESYSRQTIQQRMRHFLMEKPPTYWLSIVLPNGSLEIYSLDDLLLCFKTCDLHLGHRLLSYQQESTVRASSQVEIIEIGIFPLGHLRRRPLMIIRTSDYQLFLYEAVAYYDTSEDHQLKMRFRKWNHNLLLKEKKTL